MRNLKRALSLAVASVMLLGMMVVGTSAGYADVTSEHNEEAIAVAEAAGIMIGSEGNFNPAKNVTRNEMAVVMVNMLGLNAEDYAGTAPFTDVPAWAEPYVAAAYANGIIAGYDATTFGGEDTVTAAQAALMMMKALGYFQFQPDFGDDWMMATVKQASKLGLFDGLTSAGKATLTRNDVAQLALNTLESEVVYYGGSQGSNITTSDGTQINVGYTIQYHKEYEGAGTYDYTYNDTDDEDEDYLQLVEKLYGNDLKKEVSVDDYQANANVWTYKTKTVIKATDEAQLTYTAGVKVKDLYKALGISSATDSNDLHLDIYVDGVDSYDLTFIPGTSNTDATVIPGTANGAVAKVFFKADKTAGDKIVIMNTFIDEIDDVDKDSDDNRIIEFSTLSYKTEAFEEEDIILYTKVSTDAGSTWTVKSVELAEKQTGKLTKAVGNTEYFIDGTSIKTSAQVVRGSFAVTDTVDYYVDNYGYIISIDEADEEVNVANMALVLNDGAGASIKGVTWAKLLFTDGTTKIVDLAKNYYGMADMDTATAGTQLFRNGVIVSFKVQDDGTYKLTFVGGNPTGSQTVTNGDPAIGAVKTNSKTVFVYHIVPTGTNSDVYKVFTGYKNAMSTSANAATVASYTETNATSAALVFVTVNDNAIATNANDVAIVAFKSTNKVVDEGDGVTYYQYNAVVDGKIDTLKVATSEWSTMSGALYIASGLTYDADGIATYVGAEPTTQVTTCEYDNEAIVLGGAAKAFASDVKVYVVDASDAAIQAIDIDDVEYDADDSANGDDPYTTIDYTVNTDGKVNLIVIVKP